MARVAAAKRTGFSGTKQTTAEDAVKLINSGNTVCCSGFVAQSPPELLLRTLGKRYEETQAPKDLTLVFYGGPGDWGKLGLNHLAKPGMLRRTIGSHYGQTPEIAKLVQANKVEAYNLPMGSLSRMIRATAQGSQGHMTRIGLGTMVDPKHGGGKISAITTDDLVSAVDFLGETQLFYKALPIDVAIIRGTTADANGNITMERESLYLDVLIQAMAARASGGLVIAQVERMAAVDSLNPRNVKVPGSVVDAVVCAEDPADHPMSFPTRYHAGYSAEVRWPPSTKAMEMSARKIIARRAAMELLPNQVVNLGIGMPEGVAAVADEEGILQFVTLTTEPGTHGGIGASGHDFGPAVNYDGLLELNQQFDFYNGGGLDACFLGMADVSPKGDVNVTRVGKNLTGPGGFIDISQSTKHVNLLGTFTAGGLEVETTPEGELRIVKEGKVKKFVKQIPEITFSADQAVRHQQIVTYITERAVFHLTRDGIELVAIAPGVDLQKHVLDQMEFTPIMTRPPVPMRREIFLDKLMNLRRELFGADLTHRMHYVETSNTFFLNLATIHLDNKAQVRVLCQSIRDELLKAGASASKKVYMEVNCFGLKRAPHAEKAWHDEMEKLAAEFFLAVRYHSGRTFYHSKAANVATSGGDPLAGLPDVMTVGEAYRQVQRRGLGLAQFTFFNIAAKVLAKQHRADGAPAAEEVAPAAAADGVTKGEEAASQLVTAAQVRAIVDKVHELGMKTPGETKVSGVA